MGSATWGVLHILLLAPAGGGICGGGEALMFRQPSGTGRQRADLASDHHQSRPQTLSMHAQ